MSTTQFVIDYSAYDLATGLYVRSKVYDITSGTPVFDSNVNLSHVVNGTYAGVFAADSAKDYLINTMVYTDNTYASINSSYTPGSTKVNRVLNSNLQTEFPRGVAFDNFHFPMFSTDDGLPVTGLTPSAFVKIDGGAFAASINTPTAGGRGLYMLDLDATELDGKIITINFTASGAFPVFATIFTKE